MTYYKVEYNKFDYRKDGLAPMDPSVMIAKGRRLDDEEVASLKATADGYVHKVQRYLLIKINRAGENSVTFVGYNPTQGGIREKNAFGKESERAVTTNKDLAIFVFVDDHWDFEPPVESSVVPDYRRSVIPNYHKRRRDEKVLPGSKESLRDVGFVKMPREVRSYRLDLTDYGNTVWVQIHGGYVDSVVIGEPPSGEE